MWTAIDTTAKTVSVALDGKDDLIFTATPSYSKGPNPVNVKFIHSLAGVTVSSNIKNPNTKQKMAWAEQITASYMNTSGIWDFTNQRWTSLDGKQAEDAKVGSVFYVTPGQTISLHLEKLHVINNNDEDAAQILDYDLKTPVEVKEGMMHEVVINMSEAEEWVDLGLPSGTLWGTKNIGACKPEMYGNFYRWANLKQRMKGDSNTSDPEASQRQSNGEMQDTYDIAYQILKGEGETPTYTQVEELKKWCKWEWMEEGNTEFSGVPGFKIYASGYYNTDSKSTFIFIPANGYYDDNGWMIDYNTYQYKGSTSEQGVKSTRKGSYWTSTYNNGTPHTLNFGAGWETMPDNEYQTGQTPHALGIRPVKVQKISGRNPNPTRSNQW